MENYAQVDGEGEPELKLKPCIAELLRTDYCQPGLIMVVDKILVVTMANTEQNQAYRLYLSDGEKNIQAVLKPLMHRFVWTGEIREGSYVMLDKYTLAKGKKLMGEGYVAYLAIADIHTIGREERYTQDDSYSGHSLLTELAKEQRQPPTRHNKYHGFYDAERDKFAVFKDPGADDNPLGFVANYDAERPKIHGHANSVQAKTQPKHTEKRKRDTASDALGELSPNKVSAPKQRRTSSSGKVSNVIAKNTTPLQAKSFPDNLPQSLEFYTSAVVAHEKRCHQHPVPHSEFCNCVTCDLESYEDMSNDRKPKPSTAQKPKRSSTTKKSLLQATTSLSQPALRALETHQPLKRIRKPLDLYRLSNKFTKPIQLRDVFAVVDWVDNKTINRGVKLIRNIRIVDPSTDKRILLSVFVDPLNFTPAVGTIALFRNLRAHGWEEGSLNACCEDCKGYDWFIPNPVNIAGCDVEAMREWWEQRQEQQREWRIMKAGIEAVMDGDVMAKQCHADCFGRADLVQAKEMEALGLVGGWWGGK